MASGSIILEDKTKIHGANGTSIKIFDGIAVNTSKAEIQAFDQDNQWIKPTEPAIGSPLLFDGEKEYTSITVKEVKNYTVNAVYSDNTTVEKEFYFLEDAMDVANFAEEGKTLKSLTITCPIQSRPPKLLTKTRR